MDEIVYGAGSEDLKMASKKKRKSKRRRHRESSDYTMGVLLRNIKDILSRNFSLELLRLHEGEPGDPDFFDRFPSIEFVTRLPLTPQEMFDALRKELGSWADYTKEPILENQLEDSFQAGRWAIVENVPLEFRRVVVFPTKEPGFRIISTIPRGLMSEEEADQWWGVVIGAVHNIALKAEEGFPS